MKIKEYILGELLHLANSAPPIWKFEFYRLKDKIIVLHGTYDGIDIQHIVKECFNCDGTGEIRETQNVWGVPFDFLVKKCPCCNHGIYDEFWTTLPRHRVGRHIFHSVLKKFHDVRLIPDIEYSNTIEGYVQHHHPKYYLNAEAAYWLLLIYDRKLFKMRFGHTGYPSAKFTPMVILSTFLSDLSRIPHKIQRTLNIYTKWRQSHCDHMFPEGTKHHRDLCPWCYIERWEVEDPIPF